MKKDDDLADEIQVLEWRDAVRKRPAMYVGSTGLTGIKILLKMLIQTVFHKTKSDRIEFDFFDKMSGKVVFENLNSTIKDSTNEEFQLSSSEFAILNALSNKYEFKLHDSSNKVLTHQVYRKGILKKGKVENKELFANTLEISFTLDDTIWDFDKFNFFLLNDEIRELSFLCSDKLFVFQYLQNNEKSRIVYNFENGLLDMLQVEKGWVDTKMINHSKKKFDNFSIELALGVSPFCYTEKVIASFVNFSNTKEHGTHVIGLVKGLKKGLKKYIKKHFPNKKVLVKSSFIKKYLFAAIHIEIDQPTFWGPTRGMLQNYEVIKPISKYVSKITLEELEKDPKFSEEIIRHFEYV